MAKKTDELIPTRATLLHRMKDLEDGRSWQEFFDIYWKLIYVVSRNAELSDAEAQEVVQEVMISVSKKMPDFQYDPTIGSFKSWLLIKTRWCIRGQFRKRLKSARHVPLAGAGDDSSVDSVEIVDTKIAVVDDRWDEDWQRNLVAVAQNKLKRKYPEKFQIFDCCVNKEWPVEKVAERFAIRPAQVHLTKHRFTAAIKREVRRLERKVI